MLTSPRVRNSSSRGRSGHYVNYNSDTLAKVDTMTTEVTQTVAVPLRPIGVTFDPSSREVWVAIYSGAITVLR